MWIETVCVDGLRNLRLAAAKAEIERRAAERHAREKAAYEKKVAERAVKEAKTGKKPRGKEPKEPKPGPTNKDQVNLTDEESRIMPVSGGGFEQAYNVQAAVDIQRSELFHRFNGAKDKAWLRYATL